MAKNNTAISKLNGKEIIKSKYKILEKEVEKLNKNVLEIQLVLKDDLNLLQKAAKISERTRDEDVGFNFLAITLSFIDVLLVLSLTFYSYLQNATLFYLMVTLGLILVVFVLYMYGRLPKTRMFRIKRKESIVLGVVVVSIIILFLVNVFVFHIRFPSSMPIFLTPSCVYSNSCLTCPVNFTLTYSNSAVPFCNYTVSGRNRLGCNQYNASSKKCEIMNVVPTCTSNYTYSNLTQTCAPTLSCPLGYIVPNGFEVCYRLNQCPNGYAFISPSLFCENENP